jgi:hypothetical protein
MKTEIDNHDFDTAEEIRKIYRAWDGEDKRKAARRTKLKLWAGVILMLGTLAMWAIR